MRPPRRPGVCGWGLAVMLFLGLSGTAVAQIVPIQVYVSNNPEQWDYSQNAFSPYGDTSIFVVMTSGVHPGYTYAGECVFSLAQTHQELYRLRIDNQWVPRGHDIVRSRSFRMGWPAAPVAIACWGDWAPDQVAFAQLGPELWYGTAYPTPQPIPVPPPAPYPTEPVYEPPPPPPPAPDCRSTLLARGHPASSLMFCEDTNPDCAVALLEMGHPPSALIFCSDVSNVVCAVNLLRAGGSPSEIIFCE